MLAVRESETIESCQLSEDTTTGAKMRVALLSLDFGLLLLTFVALVQIQGTNANSELCPSSNCLPSEQCDVEIPGGNCQNSEETCCSIVKTEFRTHCRHWGGECMDRCNERLTRQTTDCPVGKPCCILV